MKRSRFAVLILLAGCDNRPAVEPPGGKPKGPWIGLSAALAQAASIDAWMVSDDPMKNRDYLTYPETSGRTPVQPSESRSLTSLLSNPASFSDTPGPCYPSPGFKVRYARPDAEPIWMLFCLDCAELFIYEGSQFREHKELDPSVMALTALFRKIFPNDGRPQKLK